MAGLTADDFEVKQDGIPQTITNFYAVSGGKVLLEDGTVDPARQRPRPSPRCRAVVKAHYVFYVDNLNIQPQNRNRMFKRLKEFIPQAIGPNAEGMVVTYNRSLKVRRRFTSDGQRALGADRGHRARHRRRHELPGRAARRDLEDRRREIATEAQGIAKIVRAVAAQRPRVHGGRDHSRRSTTLAGLQGRKNFLYISEGLPADGGPRDLRGDPREVPGPVGHDAGVRLRHELASTSRSSRRPTRTASRSTRSTRRGWRRPTSCRPPRTQARQRRARQRVLRAREHAGPDPHDGRGDGRHRHASTPTTGRRRLDQIAADFSNFYSLGYRSAKGATDRPHKIEVTVKKKGLRVRTRTSFVEKSVETRTAEAVLASLHYARATTRSASACRSATPSRTTGRTTCLPVRIAVPIGKLGLRAVGRPVRGPVLRLLRRPRRLRKAVGPADPEAADQEFPPRTSPRRSARTSTTTPAHRRAGRPEDRGRRARLVSNLTSYLQKNVFVSVLPKEKPPETGKPARVSGG